MSKVLVVEDEESLREALVFFLEKEGHDVSIAVDGEEALQVFESSRADLILLDLMLPKMDGISISKSLRSQNIHTPILMLTAKGEIDDKVLGLNSGADDYLVKPFAFE